MPGIAAGVIINGGKAGGASLSKPSYNPGNRQITGKGPKNAAVTIFVNGASVGTATANAQGLYSLTLASAPPAGAKITATAPLASGETGIPGAVDPARFMFFATRAKVPSGNVFAAPSSQNYAASRIKFATPEYALTSFRFHWSGFALTEGGNSPQETAVPGNDTIIDEAFLLAGGTKYPLLFSGAAGVTIASAALGAWCDEVAVFVPGESDIVVVTKWHTPTTTGNFIPVYRYQAHRGEKAWHAASLAELTALVDADAPASAGWSASYGGQNQLAAYGPDFMVAKGDWDGRPVALITCDSIGLERQEFGPAADARGNLGWLRRWLDKKEGLGRIPFFPMGVPGAASSRELTGSGSTIATRRWSILDEIIAFNNSKRPFTVNVNQLGQNDTSSSYRGSSTVGFLDRCLGFVSRLRSRYSGIKVVAFPPLGRTNSSDAWVTQTFASQNVYPADASSDNTGKWRLRADILAKFNGICDEAIDTFAAWTGSVLGMWPTRDELPSTTLAEAVGTDGVATYDKIKVSDPSLALGEQRMRFYAPDGSYIGFGQSIGYSGNTLTLISPIAFVMPAGTVIKFDPTHDGVHPQSIMVKRLADGIPQSEKAKLVA